MLELIYSESESEDEDEVYELDLEVVALAPLQRFLAFLDIVPNRSEKTPMELFDMFIATGHAVLSKAEIVTVECGTRGQSANPTWLRVREGLCGSSIFKRICTRTVSLTTKPNQDPSKLLKTIMGKSAFDEDELPDAMEFGRIKEPKARALYFSQEKDKHEGLVISERGILLSPDYPFCGSSPDGMLSCRCHEPWLIEIKCCHKKKYQPPHKAAQYYGCKKVNGTWKLPEDHRFYYQIQGQLLFTRRTRCVLVIYSNGKILPIEVPFNPEFAREMMCTLQTFVRQFLVPHIVETSTKSNQTSLNG